jgi:hypothetical protein
MKKNPITALKVAGLAQAAKTVGKGVGAVFQASGDVGKAVGRELGSESLGQAAGYAAPLLIANYAANQYAPTRKGKAWLGQRIGTAGNAIGNALVPSDYGTRPGDFGGYY